MLQIPNQTVRWLDRILSMVPHEDVQVLLGSLGQGANFGYPGEVSGNDKELGAYYSLHCGVFYAWGDQGRAF